MACPSNNWKDGHCGTDIRTTMMFYSVTQEDVRAIDLSIYLLKMDSLSYCCSKTPKATARGTFQEVPPDYVNRYELVVTNGNNQSKTTLTDQFVKEQEYRNGDLQSSWSYNSYHTSLQCPQSIRNRAPRHPAIYTSCQRSPAPEIEHSSSMLCTSHQYSLNNAQERTSPAANTLPRCCCQVNEQRHTMVSCKPSQSSPADELRRIHSTVSYEMSPCSTVSEQGCKFYPVSYNSSHCSSLLERLLSASPASYKSQRPLRNKEQQIPQVSSISSQRSRSRVELQTSQAAYTASQSSTPQEVLPISPTVSYTSSRTSSTYRALKSFPYSSYGSSPPPDSETHFSCSQFCDQSMQYSQNGGKCLADSYMPSKIFQTSRKTYAPTPISPEPSHQSRYVRRLYGTSDCLQIIVNAL
ncbi:uncharacterized protein LOC135204205 [Macrobrachium nipponense]|uniref:uncharacterized protein LOC135204205 n=1 Tax=Macrobrachium nipponense TaxID=159736 RepID=UPI0030C86810